MNLGSIVQSSFGIGYFFPDKLANKLGKPAWDSKLTLASDLAIRYSAFWLRKSKCGQLFKTSSKFTCKFGKNRTSLHPRLACSVNMIYHNLNVICHSEYRGWMP
jgi:hypothetical protein